MVEPEPPDPFRVHAGVDEMPDGLVERRGLPDAPRTKNKLEAMRIIPVQRLPQLLRQRALDLSRKRGRHDAASLPRVLLIEHPLEVFRLRSPSSQRPNPLLSSIRLISLMR